MIITWWSGGVTSAVACKLAIDLFDNVRVVMIDTHNEHEDTYRFRSDCEKWYEKPIEVISCIGDKYSTIEDVWERYLSLNVATGAICSRVLKRDVREKWQKDKDITHQVFGFEFDKKEFNRALGLSKVKKTNAIYPLLMYGYDKSDCISIIESAGIQVPVAYQLGFKNNNCLKTGCVQGGIGYWKKMKTDFPATFDKMAETEHRLTDLKGEPVTMLKDQGNEAKQAVLDTGIKWKCLVFLKKHPAYPELKCIDDMAEREVKPLTECNGFCGTDIFSEKSETRSEIFFDQSV